MANERELAEFIYTQLLDKHDIEGVETSTVDTTADANQIIATIESAITEFNSREPEPENEE